MCCLWCVSMSTWTSLFRARWRVSFVMWVKCVYVCNVLLCMCLWRLNLCKSLWML